MTTAKEIIYDAFYEIKVKREGVPLENSEAQVGIRYLNNMMAVWEALGIDLNYTEVSTLADTVTVPAGANQGIIAHLGIHLANQFNAEVTPSLSKMATEGYSAILDLVVDLTESDYPSILPIGSGNNQDSSYKYYTESE